MKDKETAQALAEFLHKEATRHMGDIIRIRRDLRKLKEKWGVTPTGKYVDIWIEV
ncbi:MAG: hypothetical protein ABIL39_10675 [candidate division WOR-3 bacterium]